MRPMRRRESARQEILRRLRQCARQGSGPGSGNFVAARAGSQYRVTPESSSTEALDGERKTVTALFADIKGSTELMEELDPEEARAIIDPALKLMIDAVHRYDGYLVQSTGDGIFALFGDRSRMRITRSARSMRRCACRRRCGGTRRSCVRLGICRSRRDRYISRKSRVSASG
jgi:class 3 adenylate cyclase